MPNVPSASMPRIVALIFLALVGFGAAAAERSPAAPTIPDAHHYFQSLITSNGVTAIYETRSRSGEIIGYESFPVQEYAWVACRSGLVLKNGVRIEIDWSVVEKAQSSDGTLSILQGPNVQFTFFHMVTLEGGVVVVPSNTIPRLIFGISDELSRNRLSKAIDLLSSACRSKSKFD